MKCLRLKRFWSWRTRCDATNCSDATIRLCVAVDGRIECSDLSNQQAAARLVFDSFSKTHWFGCSFECSFSLDCLFVSSFIHSFNHSFIRLDGWLVSIGFIDLIVCSSIHSFILLLTRLFIHSFILSSIQLFAHSIVCLINTFYTIYRT